LQVAKKRQRHQARARVSETSEINTESQVIGIGNTQRRPISGMTLLKRREPTHQMAPTYLPTSSLHLTTRERDQGESRKQMICLPATNETGVTCVAQGETGVTCVPMALPCGNRWVRCLRQRTSRSPATHVTQKASEGGLGKRGGWGIFEDSQLCRRLAAVRKSTGRARMSPTTENVPER
jgi:hypothetical protein